MTLETNNARIEILREYLGTISIEGEGGGEIVVRHRSHRHTAEEIYNELIGAED